MPNVEDPGVRYLLASNLRDLGLFELARRMLGTLTGAAAEAPPAVTLNSALAGETGHSVSVEARIERARLTFEVIAERAVGFERTALDESLTRVIDDEARFEVHVARDGTEIRARSASVDPGGWTGLLRATLAETLSSLGDLGVENSPPLTVEGLGDPRLLSAIAARCPGHVSGYWRGLNVVEPSLERAVVAGVIDPAVISVMGEERTKLFVGPGAGAAYSDWLSERIALSSVGPWIGEPTGARAADRLREASAAQSALAGRLRSRWLGPTSRRGASHWLERLSDVSSGAGGSLRVLIPTCRFSTYIQHSSRGLAAAFRRAGHEAEVLIEPDASTNLLDVSYLDACERFDPDLVVLVNYPRASRPGAFPEDVPFVCWIQDHMPHLYDRAIGAAQSELDFTAGHCPHELYTTMGYTPERALASPVVVDPGAFHDGPISDSDRARFSCDIAYVSHQSEPFETMAARLAEEAGSSGGRGMIEKLVPRVREAVDLLTSETLGRGLRLAVGEARRAARVGDANGAVVEARLLHLAAWPLAERLIRHRVVRWACELADRDGLSFRLFGHGWEAHPEFARFACGPIEHGEALRACYRSAGVHLHATGRAMVHQRVLECALSGGFPLCNYYYDATPCDARLAIRHRLDPADGVPGSTPGSVAFERADHPSLLWDAMQRQELGLPVRSTVEVDAALLRSATEMAEPEGMGLAFPQGLFPLLRPFVFTDQSDFEARIRLSLSDDVHRSRWSRVLRERVRRDYTTDRFVARLLPFMRRSLARAVGDSGAVSTPIAGEHAAA